MMPRIPLLLVIVLASWSSGLVAGDEPSSSVKKNIKPTAVQLEFFRQQVKPILEMRCLKCHGGETKIRGKLRLTSQDHVLRGGETGPAVSLKKPSESLLLEAVRYESLEMPPTGKLPQAEIDILVRWVKLGLPFDEKAIVMKRQALVPPAVDEKAKNFWSFRPVVKPAIPAVQQGDWVRNPIDAFVLARLEDAKLTPAAPVEKTALLRRAYYSLVGLPPDPEVVETFLSDRSPDAFEKIVDQLLESTQYGERAARHWLDLVRYAESNSYERDGTKPFVWRYRDYVIRSLNQDKPYDEFVLEQLAGDELPTRTPEQLIATGYYRLGTWQDEPVDRVQELYEDLDDIVMTTSQVFLGLTMNCARCHDHKLDPLPQRDYYRFMAFFHNINRYGVRNAKSVAQFSLRDIMAPREQSQHQGQVAEHLQRVEKVEKQIAAIEKRVIGDFQPVEKQDFKFEQHKIPLLKKRVPRLLSKQQFQKYVELKKQQRQLTNVKPAALTQALCVTEMGRQPRETFVLARGNAHAPGDQVEPGFPEVLGFSDPVIEELPPEKKSSGRRTALARWIIDPRNPLTARVLVNRLWQQHFGRGIVQTPNDFGFQGMAPTHPQLLDWLASQLVEGDWKLKRIHKLILMSSAYQMASQAQPDVLARDPENKLFSRFAMRRLSAEEIRDTILSVTGSLNPRMFGPSIYPDIPREVMLGQSRPGEGWGNSSLEDKSRRSIYIHTKRSLAVPFISAFDGPDTDTTCPIRFETTQPTQSLEMLNGPFTHQQAAAFGNYLRKQLGVQDTRGQVSLALRRSLQRPVTDQQIEQGLEFIKQLQEQHKVSAAKALDYFCLVMLNLNELIYLD
ncbi:MAG: PSD1 and planctomycete cytochrome C domain-containing protein [Pirellulaceae bacterium]